MKVAQILQNKGHEVYSIEPRARLSDAVEAMVRRRCGALVVLENDQLVGIITERDLLCVSAAGLGGFEELSVANHMTTEVLTGSPDDTVPQVMGVLTENRVRHLPILEDGQVVGIISIGDVVKAQHDALKMENHYLRSYLSG